ncbi:hypothetical protein VNO77_22165 [Canavalia gladiata]|uniref:Uncharacterized protein n=1 Tax=Canavalia gladiata TaxID=3824 RepID=A0AAN9QAS7_CANGL
MVQNQEPLVRFLVLFSTGSPSCSASCRQAHGSSYLCFLFNFSAGVWDCIYLFLALILILMTYEKSAWISWQ